MEDTPLGQVVAIRSERDAETIRRFTSAQKRLRAEWAAFKLENVKSHGDKKNAQMGLQAMLAALCGKEVSKG